MMTFVCVRYSQLRSCEPGPAVEVGFNPHLGPCAGWSAGPAPQRGLAPRPRGECSITGGPPSDRPQSAQVLAQRSVFRESPLSERGALAGARRERHQSSRLGNGCAQSRHITRLFEPFDVSPCSTGLLEQAIQSSTTRQMRAASSVQPEPWAGAPKLRRRLWQKGRPAMAVITVAADPTPPSAT
jgi:hypothetical protein